MPILLKMMMMMIMLLMMMMTSDKDLVLAQAAGSRFSDLQGCRHLCILHENDLDDDDLDYGCS